MSKQRIKTILINFMYPLICVAVAVVMWVIVAHAMGSELIFPDLGTTLKEFFSLFGSVRFWQGTLGTIVRSVGAFELSFLFAAICAVAAGVSDVFRKLFAPLIALLRSVPTMSVILILLIWFRSSIAPLGVAFLVIFPTLYSALYAAIMGVDSRLIEMSRVYRVPRARLIRKLYLPSVAPAAFEAAASGLNLTVKLVIAAEVLAQTKRSMGLLMQHAQMNIETAQLMALTIAAVLVSLLLEGVIRLIGSLVVRWK